MVASCDYDTIRGLSSCFAVQFEDASSIVRHENASGGSSPIVIGNHPPQPAPTIPKPSENRVKVELTSPGDGGSNEAPDLGRPRHGGNDRASALKSDG